MNLILEKILTSVETVVNDVKMKEKKQIKEQKFKNHEWKIEISDLECGTCKIFKPIECFSRRKDTDLGVRKTCKNCRKKIQQ